LPAMLPVIVLSLPLGAAAHGMMTKPTSRNGGTLAEGGCPHDSNVDFTPCIDHMSWFCGSGLAPQTCASQPTTKTLHDERMKTSPVGFQGHLTPWDSPGFARPVSACGTATYGRDGVKLQKTQGPTWKQNSQVEVGWAIWANHGGGYAWRLCPAAEALTEDCFQRHPLAFADETTVVQYTDGRAIPIASRTTTQGTTPANSQWRRNPIPSLEFPGFIGKPAFDPPCPGCSGSKSPVQIPTNHGLSFSLIDKVVVPDLPDGDYVLQWRWDTEDQAQQVWTNCADVVLGAAPAPAPGPAPGPAPAPAPAPGAWRRTKGWNCFTGRGGYPVPGHDGIAPEKAVATEQECQALCESTEGCTAFVMAANLPGPCFLRKSILVAQCEQSDAYDLYSHGIPPPLGGERDMVHV